MCLFHTSHSSTRLCLAALLAAVLVWFTPFAAHAATVTPDMAKNVVRGWLNLDPTPLDKSMSTTVDRVVEYDDDGLPAYYIVYMNPKGLVIVPGDTLVEPIIGFLPEATAYEDNDQNPLGALVRSDVPARVEHVRMTGQTFEKSVKPEMEDNFGTNPAKWDTLLSGLDKGISKGEIDDLFVDALVSSQWSQSTARGLQCYNRYTPSNYVCGCVATAMAQLMRFHQHPMTGVGTAAMVVSVDGTNQTVDLRGGDGSGGAYSWTDMTLVPAAAVTQDQCDAIGALTADAGTSVNMAYTSGSSGTDTLKAATAFKDTFKYSNAVQGFNSYKNIPSENLYDMVNTNLDAGLPVLFGITGDPGGHAIVGDGYGRNGATMYHHLNMGWAGSSDAWYNLPTIDAGYDFDSVYKVVYNVYKSGTGEIVSGRVYDSNGNPVSGVSISANSGDYTATTNSNGIYALTNIPSNTDLTISATKIGYSFRDISVSTSTPVAYTTTTGNVWEADFGSSPYSTVPALNPWGMLSAALLLGAAFVLRRRQRRRI